MTDNINHPKHYTSHPSGVECIQVTEWMGFNLGNAVKYVWRADEKGNAVEDLQKAAWYIQREIERRQVEKFQDVRDAHAKVWEEALEAAAAAQDVTLDEREAAHSEAWRQAIEVAGRLEAAEVQFKWRDPEQPKAEPINVADLKAGDRITYRLKSGLGKLHEAVLVEYAEPAEEGGKPGLMARGRGVIIRYRNGGRPNYVQDVRLVEASAS